MVFFAMPLLLTQQNLAQEDIGWPLVVALGLGPLTVTIILLVGTLTVGVRHGGINAP